MSNQILGTGDFFTVTAPTGGHTVDVAVGYTNFVGWPLSSVTGGALVSMQLTGRVSVTTKKAGVTEDWAIGDKIYLTSTGDYTEGVTGNTLAGLAAAASATGATTGEIFLNMRG